MKTIKQILNRIKTELNKRTYPPCNMDARLSREVQSILNERNDNS